MNTPQPAWQPPPCLAPAPGPGEVHVWRIDWAAQRWTNIDAVVVEEERARALAFRNHADRRRFLVGRGFLRILLGAYLRRTPGEILLAVEDHGKPCLPAATNLAGWQFNLSHSEMWILLALARHRRVGVDVEQIRPMDELEHMTEIVFSLRERIQFRSLPEDAKLSAFFRCWVRKEAYVKGLGMGMAVPLDTLEVSFGPELPPRLERAWDGDPSGDAWVLRELNVAADYAAAIAVEGAIDQLACWDTQGSSSIPFSAIGT